MQHRVALARKQGVDAYPAFSRQLLEAAPLEFVGDEDFALLVGQFVERKFQFLKKHISDVERFGSGGRRWEKVFKLQQLAVFVLDCRVAEVLRPLLAPKVRDAIARDAKKPASHV